MTREEWIERITFKSKNMQGFNERCHILINALFDDFESRNCENCKYVGYRKSDGTSYCVLNNTTYSDPVKDNFGCNKFERK